MLKPIGLSKEAIFASFFLSTAYRIQHLFLLLCPRIFLHIFSTIVLYCNFLHLQHTVEVICPVHSSCLFIIIQAPIAQYCASGACLSGFPKQNFTFLLYGNFDLLICSIVCQHIDSTASCTLCRDHTVTAHLCHFGIACVIAVFYGMQQ